MNVLVRIWGWLTSWLRQPRPQPAPYRTLLVSEVLPAELSPDTLYIVEEGGYLEQAAMICPCGCGSTLNMNLLPDERPCWTVKQRPDGSTTLHPSVWRQKGCKSHFWFRAGRVEWCRDQ